MKQLVLIFSGQIYTYRLLGSFLPSYLQLSIFFLQRRRGFRRGVTSPFTSFLQRGILRPSLTNTSLLVISRVAIISQQLSYSLEQSLLNTLYNSLTILFTIIESLLLSIYLLRIQLIPLITQLIVVSKQPYSTSSYYSNILRQYIYPKPKLGTSLLS